MNRSPFSAFALLVVLAGLGVLGVLGVGITQILAETSSAQISSEIPPQVPDALKVSEDHPLVLKAIAKGSQIYTCQAKADDPNTLAWTLKAPEAQLFDSKGASIGTHYAGPTWASTDRSQVMGKLKAKVDAPQPDNIPWLLLNAKSHEGNGIFASVDWVQRLNTMGGKAPTTGCDRDHLNQDLAVPYTADYYFYGAERSSQPPSPY